MKLLHYNPHLRYVVQYVLPVDNPENNVCVTYKRGVYIFEIPLNHPFAHTVGLKDLIDSVNAMQLSTLSTGLNNSETEYNLSELYVEKKTKTEGEVAREAPTIESNRVEGGSCASFGSSKRNRFGF